MFFVRYYADGKVHVLTGDIQSVVSIAHMLEEKKIYFKVGSIGSDSQSQSQFGLGNFRYWLDPNQYFYANQEEK